MISTSSRHLRPTTPSATEPTGDLPLIRCFQRPITEPDGIQRISGDSNIRPIPRPLRPTRRQYSGNQSGESIWQEGRTLSTSWPSSLRSLPHPGPRVESARPGEFSELVTTSNRKNRSGSRHHPHPDCQQQISPGPGGDSGGFDTAFSLLLTSSTPRQSAHSSGPALPKQSQPLEVHIQKFRHKQELERHTLIEEKL